MPNEIKQRAMLLNLRDAAKECRDPEYRFYLREAADSLEDSIQKLYANPTENNMIRVNGLWTKAYWLLDRVPEDDDDGGGAGLREGARLAA